MVNACFNWGKARLVLGVRKLGSSTLCSGLVKLDLADFLLFLLLLPMTLLLSILVASRALASEGLVFNIEMSGAAILLKP